MIGKFRMLPLELRAGDQTQVGRLKANVLNALPDPGLDDTDPTLFRDGDG